MYLIDSELIYKLENFIKMFFKSRNKAGKLLAEKLSAYAGDNTIVLAIPIGGIIVGCTLASKLNAILDISLATVKFFPGRPQTVVAAFDDEMEIVIDKTSYYNKIHQEIVETQQYLHTLYHDLAVLYSHPDLSGKTVIITDDGPLTDHKIIASVNLARRKHAEKIIVAVPVIAPYLIRKIKAVVDELVFLDNPDNFYYVNNYYKHNDLPKVEEIKNFVENKCRKQKHKSKNN